MHFTLKHSLVYANKVLFSVLQYFSYSFVDKRGTLICENQIVTIGSLSLGNKQTRIT